MVKSSARQIGDAEVFGLGVLDMEKLFDFEIKIYGLVKS